MSTPIKPADSPAQGGGGPADSRDASKAEGRPGEFRELVEAETDGTPSAEVRGASPSSAGSGSHADRVGTSTVDEVSADLAAGRVDADRAIEQIVQRALKGASGLPASRRAALESQLRDALAEDPTLVALQKDLERASKA